MKPSNDRCMYSMATDKQIAANRKNALKSTGPKSALGKRIASRNSTRHGFYATTVVLPSEDGGEFNRLSRRLAKFYAPIEVCEEEQVKTIAETRWQLRRSNLVDTELFQIYGFYENEERGVGTAFAQDATQRNAFSKLTRYQRHLLHKLQTAEKEVARLQSIRLGGSPNTITSAPSRSSERGKDSVSSSVPESSAVDATAQRALNWLRQRD
jgi:hypothetical protein